MNSIKHAEISARRRGGRPADYLDIHQFIDSTKNLCSDNRHRIFHTMWAVNEIVLPIFGHQRINSDGDAIDVKDLCEKDHLLVDFRHRFIPTLSDFVQAMDFEITPAQRQMIEKIHETYTASPQYSNEVSRLLLSPLALTGQLKSLVITHNSWFLLSILPRYIDALTTQTSQIPHTETITKETTTLKHATLWQGFNFLGSELSSSELSGDVIFHNMRFEQWMNHGADYPPSAQAIKKIHNPS